MTSKTTANRSSKSLTQRALLTAVSGMLQQAASFLVSFLVTPLVIRGLGAELYGAWIMIQQTVGYLALSDMRPMGTLKFTLAVRQHVEDVEEKKRQIGAALIIWVVMSPLFILLGAAAVWTAPRFIRTAPEHIWAVQVAMGLVVLSVMLNRLLSVPANVLRGLNLDYKAMGLNALTVLFGGAMTALAIWMGWGLPGVAGASILGIVIVSGARFWVAWQVVPWFGIARPTFSELLRFLKLSGWLFFSSLSGLLLKSSDLLLVGVIFDPSATAIYATTGAVLRLTVESVARLLASANAGIAGLCGKEDWERVASLRTEMQQMLLLVMTVLGVGVLALNESFLRLWIGEGFFGGPILNLLLVLIAFQTLIYRVDGVIVDSLLEFRPKAWGMFLSGLLGLLVGIVLSHYWGINGVAFGQLLGYFILMIFLPVLINRRTSLSFMTYVGSLVRPVSVACFLLLFGYEASRFLHPKTWIEFALVAILIGGITAGIMWQIGLPKTGRMIVLNRYRNRITYKY